MVLALACFILPFIFAFIGISAFIMALFGKINIDEIINNTKDTIEILDIIK
jgi:hypothetical protein